MKVYNKPMFWVGLSGFILQGVALLVAGLVAFFSFIGVQWIAVIWYALIDFFTAQKMIIMLVALFFILYNVASIILIKASMKR